MRPKLYDTAEEMQTVINDYFMVCDDNTIEVYSKAAQEVIDMKKPIPYTIEGLCAVLDMTRQSLLNYAKNEEFFDIIKKAKQNILRNQVEAGMIGTADKTMTIFLLKNNHNYADRQEVEQTTTIKEPTTFSQIEN